MAAQAKGETISVGPAYPDFSIVVSGCQQDAIQREGRAADTASMTLQLMKRGEQFKTPDLEGNEDCLGMANTLFKYLQGLP